MRCAPAQRRPTHHAGWDNRLRARSPGERSAGDCCGASHGDTHRACPPLTSETKGYSLCGRLSALLRVSESEMTNRRRNDPVALFPRRPSGLPSSVAFRVFVPPGALLRARRRRPPHEAFPPAHARDDVRIASRGMACGSSRRKNRGDAERSTAGQQVLLSARSSGCFSSDYLAAVVNSSHSRRLTARRPAAEPAAAPPAEQQSRRRAAAAPAFSAPPLRGRTRHPPRLRTSAAQLAATGVSSFSSSCLL